MIGIGINEDVLIAKASLDQKKNLQIVLEEGARARKPKQSLFDRATTARTTEETSGQFTLNIFPPLVPKKMAEYTKEKTLNMIFGDIARLIKQLSHILEQYMTVDKIDLDAADVQFANTGITDNDTLEARLTDQDVLNKIYNNIVARFVELMQPHLGTNGEPVRVKLIRQSKEKNYAMLPNRNIADNPFIELMSVPTDQSRVKFTDYEIKEGLNSSAPADISTAENKGAAKTSASTAKKDVAEVNPFAEQ